MKAAVFSIVLAAFPAAVLADAKAGEKKAQLCLLCHKPDNVMAYVPTLEGQQRDYLIAQLRAFKMARRPDSTMQTNVAGLSERDMRDIADYFASRKPRRWTGPLDDAKAAKGREKAAELRCAACHKPDYSGDKAVPRLAGLHPGYAVRQIADIALKKRAHPGEPAPREADAEDLAHYFARLE